MQVDMQKINKYLLIPTALISDTGDAIRNEEMEYEQQTKNQLILNFMNYFQNEWIKTNDGWYEGIQRYTPSTNNALEATNRTIKDDGKFRELHALSRFLTIGSTIVNNWSIERDVTSVNGKILATEQMISLELWTLSY